MMYTCAPAGPSPSQGRPHRATDGTKTLTIDIHCHCAAQKASDIVAAATKGKARAPERHANALTQEVAKQQAADIKPKMNSVEVRLADMDRMGVDIQAVSPAPGQFFYWTPPDVGREASMAINDHLAKIVADHPDRFVALGAVPLQDADMATAELERCVKKLGMRGVEIGTNVDGKELSEKRLDKFFAKAEELDIVIFMHPSGFTQPDRFFNHYFTNLIGNPLDTTVAIGHLIFDGVMDRHPGLKICAAHGGGYAGAYPGRFDHGYHARADCREHIASPPSTYLKRFYFDTMVFEPDQLAFLIEKHGSDHILLGTDYPYDMGHYDPHDLIGRVPDIGDEDRRRIKGLNAARLLKIPVSG
ncbi:MAG: amidohydrolase family protein [Alphaproteobacteria bacterium]|nr:amidohydrolase family protein [Alphaproteobacteria bacterium]